MCHWCSYHVLMSSVIYYWTDSCQHGIYLFYTIKKQTTTESALIFISKSFNLKASFAHSFPHWKTQERPFDVIYCLYKMKQSRWLLCIAKNCDWSMKIMPLSCLNQVVPFCGMKLKIVKSANLRNAGKVKSVVVNRAALWVQKLGRCLEYCRSWKITLGKLAVLVNTGGQYFSESFSKNHIHVPVQCLDKTFLDLIFLPVS